MINIFGLAVAIACCIFLFYFSKNIITANSFIKEREKIFLVASQTKKGNNELFLWGKSPSNLTSTMKVNEVQYYTRFKYKQASVRHRRIVLEEQIQLVDEDFLKIFNFKLALGEPTALANPNNIVLSKKASTKFFGTENPLGKELSLNIDEKIYPVVVGAVAEEFPNNAYFSFNILVPYALLSRSDLDWSEIVDATFVKVERWEEIETLRITTNQLIDLYNNTEPRNTITSFVFIPFNLLTTSKYDVESSVVGKENPTTVYVAAFFAIILLSIACINFINISLASASKRLTEIGFRKSVGASRGQLVFQFLSENISMCFFATFLGVIISQFILLPILNGFFPFEITIGLLDPWLWSFLVIVGLITGVCSGIYPALYISAFSAHSILRGNNKFGNNNLIFRLFLGLQFAFTYLLIFAAVVFIANSQFQQNLNWGYDNRNIIVIPVNGVNQFNALSNKLEQFPELVGISGAINHVGEIGSLMDVSLTDERRTVLRFEVDSSYLDLMGFEILNTGNSLTGLNRNSLVVNEKFIREFNIEGISNKYISTEKEDYEIAAVIKDFHYQNFYYPIEPLAFSLMDSEKPKYLVAKFETSDIKSINEKIKILWLSQYPDSPYTGYFQSDIFDNYFRQMSIPTNLLLVFAMISVILSSLGLYGLVSLTLASRIKELGIRKVLGASLVSLLLIVQKRFIVILLVSIAIAVPISQRLVKIYLDQVNEYHVAVGIGIILFTTSIIVFTTIISIGSNIIQIAKTNPASVLRET